MGIVPLDFQAPIPKGELRSWMLEALIPFLRGEISQSDFDDDWVEIRHNWPDEEPFHAGDLATFWWAVWFEYSDFSNQTINVSNDVYQFLTRGAAWLQTECPWNPPREMGRVFFFFRKELPVVDCQNGYSPFEDEETWQKHKHLLAEIDLPTSVPPIRKLDSSTPPETIQETFRRWFKRA